MPDVLRRYELEDLDDLLESEKVALLTGDIELLTSIMERKTELMQKLNHAPQNDFAILHAIDCKVRRNQLLMESAVKGIRSVARRMSALQRLRTRLDFYDARVNR